MSIKPFTRREFLRFGGVSAAWGALMACALSDHLISTPNAISTQGSLSEIETFTPLPVERATPSKFDEQFSSSTDNKDLVLHTLRRVFFGFTPEILEHALQLGPMGIMEDQLDYKNLDDSPAENLVSKLDLLNKSPRELFEFQPRRQIAGQFILSTLIRHIRSPRQVFEMMVDFWSNHFNIFLADGITNVLKIYDDRDVIRPHALASFHELLSASAHSPAMLIYLDQAYSTRVAPNENYARELLELHSVGVAGGYTHKDVLEVARTLTGWSITFPREVFHFNRQPGEFLFRPNNHDNENKEVMGFKIPSRSGLKGGESLIGFLASHPSTGRFLSQKLAQRFVSDNPPNTIVDKLTTTFEDSQGDIKELLRTLVASPEFASSSGKKLKRPLDFFVSLLISGQVEIIPNRRTLRALVEQLRFMGQVPHLWPTPDGYPDNAEWWSTTSGMLNRWNFALQLSRGQIPGVKIPFQHFIADGSSPADVIDLLSLQFLGQTLPTEARDILISYSAEEQLDRAIPDLAGLILGSPYFQIR